MLDLIELNGVLGFLIIANSQTITDNNSETWSDADNQLIEHMKSHRDQPISMFSKNKKIKNAQKSIAELGFKKWMDAAEKKDYSLMRMHIRQTTNDLCRVHIGDTSMEIMMDNLEPVLNIVNDVETIDTDEGEVFF